ncbi:MAG TPA: hypothetical protein VJQ56_10235 [Blastocatellia bacterium]|nr:hypothetical protein [Blastocatellia bacterium]
MSANETRIQKLEDEQARLRRSLEEMEDYVQKAPGSHSPGVPPPDVIKAEREIQTIVLRLVAIEREIFDCRLSQTASR